MVMSGTTINRLSVNSISFSPDLHQILPGYVMKMVYLGWIDALLYVFLLQTVQIIDNNSTDHYNT